MLYTALYSSEFLPGFKSLDYLSAISKLGNYYEPLHKYRDTLIEIHRVLLKNKPEILKDFPSKTKRKVLSIIRCKVLRFGCFCQP